MNSLCLPLVNSFDSRFGSAQVDLFACFWTGFDPYLISNVSLPLHSINITELIILCSACVYKLGPTPIPGVSGTY